MATHYAEQFKSTGDNTMEVEDDPKIMEDMFTEKDERGCQHDKLSESTWRRLV